MAREASRRVTASATWKETPWKAATGWPKALRLEVYPVATSTAGLAAPMVMAAVPSRSGIIMVLNT
jgi:hypothetical protein